MHHKTSMLSSVKCLARTEAVAYETGKVMLIGLCAMATKPKTTFSKRTK